MSYFTKAQYQKLLENGAAKNNDKDHFPVIKLSLPGTAFCWLLTQINPSNTYMAFGLCDLGMGFPEMGSVDLNALEELTALQLFKVQRDRLFKSKFPISVYARAAAFHEAVVEDEKTLKLFIR